MSDLDLFPHQEASLQQQMQRGIQVYDETGDLSGFRLLLGSDVGTGKTPFTIRYLDAVREFLAGRGDDRANLPVLVVCPASLKANWADEIKRWSAWIRHKADPIVLSGGSSEEVDHFLLRHMPPGWVVTNYEYARDRQPFFQGLGDEKEPAFLAIVADEAHHIKNIQAQRTVALRSVCAWFHGALSGTLMTGFPDSIFRILEWVDNPPTRMQEQRVPQKPQCGAPLASCTSCPYALKEGNWAIGCRKWDGQGEPPFTAGERTFLRVRKLSSWGPARSGYVREWGRFAIGFVDRYCRTDQYGRVTGSKNETELHSRLVQYGLIRWRRADLGLPPLTFEHRLVELTPAQWKLYENLRAGLLAIVESGELTMMPVASRLALLHYFRRATTLTPKEFTASVSSTSVGQELLRTIHRPFTQDDGAKQQFLAELAREVQEGTIHKLIVFSEWTTPLRNLPNHLGLDPRQVAFIEGDTPVKQRQQVAYRWNQDQNLKFLFLSPAAFEGLNLQGGLKQGQNGVVVILNLPWSPHQVIQAIGRMHRAGQQGTITAILLLARDTIDQKIMARLHAKQSGIEVAMDNCKSLSDLFDSTNPGAILEMV